jgi:predicted transcriptional regulator
LARRLELRVGPAADALDRFEAAWNRAAEGREARPLEVLTFADLPLLLRTLTPARWALLAGMRRTGPISVFRLAREVERDYKNVHTDVARLAEIGLVERQGRSRVAVAFDVIRAEMRL